MRIFNVFSKRHKKLWGEVPEVYQHEIIPEKLRVQIIHIWSDIFEKPQHDVLGDMYRPANATPEVFKNIHDILCREYGLLYLTERRDSVIESVHKFLLGTEETVKAIDVIELSFRYIDNYVRNNLGVFPASKISPDEAIATLNDRFQEHRVGYQYKSGQIIRVDSEFVHSEVMKPALKILSDPMYEGANEEFRNAHKHYRKRRYKECMTECVKAFESCIKTICEAKGWSHDNKNGIRLIQIVFDKGLIPSFIQTHFTALRKTLEDGAFNPRNQQSAHGQGSKINPVPEYMAAYVLHLTASNILFLAKANEEMK